MAVIARRLCNDDSACAAGRFCNPSRRCQDLAACGDNGDCPTGLFCDVAAGTLHHRHAVPARADLRRGDDEVHSCCPIVAVGNQSSCACNTQCAGGAGLCLCKEGATQGFCPCRAMSNDCGPGLTCENGVCLLGKNCFPAKGLYCDAPGPGCP